MKPEELRAKLRREVAKLLLLLYGVRLCELDQQLFLLLAAMIVNACAMAEFGEDHGRNLYGDHH